MSGVILNPPNAPEDKVIKDFEKILFNYFTGKLDLALAFNSDRIVTCENDAAGFALKDVSNGKAITGGPRSVVDNFGNVIVMGAGAQSHKVVG